jgi:hypothetical protein
MVREFHQGYFDLDQLMSRFTSRIADITERCRHTVAVRAADRAHQTALARDADAVAGKARPQQISYAKWEIWGLFDG